MLSETLLVMDSRGLPLHALGAEACQRGREHGQINDWQ